MRERLSNRIGSLSEAGAHHLTQFAEGYTESLQSSQDAIAACLEKRDES